MRVLSNLPIARNFYGWLLSPKRTMTRAGIHGLPYAVDNEKFTGKFEPARFRGALHRIKNTHGLDRCLFVVAPDEPYHARETLQAFGDWNPELTEMGFPVALAAQDGMETLDIPWPQLQALFIGGSTTWKLSDSAATLMQEAHRHNKLIHAGRVSSWTRYDQFKVKPHSIDGTHWTKRPDKYLMRWNTELTRRIQQPRLLDSRPWQPPPPT